MGILYKTAGLVVTTYDNPENPNQPPLPGRIIPRSSGSNSNPIIGVPSPVTQLQSSPFIPSPSSSSSPNGPNSNYILLSYLLLHGGGNIPSGTTIINDV